MRVLVTAEQLDRPVPGGIATYIRALEAGLAALPDGPDVARWRPTRVPASVVTRAWGIGLLRPRVTPPPDVVHATTLAMPPSRAPRSVFIHDVLWRDHPEAFPTRGRRWHERALRRVLRDADLLMAPSSETAASIGEAARREVHVVEHGSDHLPPPDSAAAEALLAGIGVTGAFLLTVSTIEPRKNLARLVQAFRAARPLMPDPSWPLVVVGPTGWGPVLAPERGVLLAGPVQGAVLAGLYAKARLLAYVPLAEGFGLPPVEAMAACTPVVASPLPGAGNAALEVDPLDVDAIADGLVRVASDDALRSRLVTAGLLRAGELTWAASARRHVDLWRTMT
jgi:glycosyltransferase involved in cell wall biosynthesis